MNETIEPADAKGWQDFANCLGVDPDLFFPERGASTREAKEVCKGCVVRELPKGDRQMRLSMASFLVGNTC